MGCPLCLDDVDLFAPGSSIRSTVQGTGSQSWSGTSMAAPHATGVAALIISEHGGDMAPAQVEREMRRRADDQGQRGRTDVYGHGLVDSGF